MNSCDSNRQIVANVRDFLQRLPSAGEESITDYLVWKWSEIDPRFKTFDARTFNRIEESRETGADFALDLWVVGDSGSKELLFQAKKLPRPYGAYGAALRYPHGSKDQLATLLSYATSRNALPLYAFYAAAESKTPTRCYVDYSSECGVYMMHAKSTEWMADHNKGKKLSREKLLSGTLPLPCLFCCPRTVGGFLEHYLDSTAPSVQVPDYVLYLLNSQADEKNVAQEIRLIEEFNLQRVRHVAVYDARGITDA